MRISIRRLLVTCAIALAGAAGTAVPALAAPSGFGDVVELTSFSSQNPGVITLAGDLFCDTISGGLFTVSGTSGSNTATTTQTVSCPTPGSFATWTTTLQAPSGNWGSGSISLAEALKTTTGVALASDTEQASLSNGITTDFGLDNASLTFASGSVTYTGFFDCPAGTADTLTLKAEESSSGATGTAVQTVSCTGGFVSLSIPVNPDSVALPFTSGATTFQLYHGRATEILIVLEGTLDVGFVT